ncbi:MAG: hypothetical protein IT447_07765 [Phycisphaerales bacterium]|jgi:4-hydroxybenzoate polyprenyltransferase|nr:hypothetical protein [Phycisphaerales bacterium]
MLVRLSGRLLSLLQLTRMALVFTAIADSGCGLLLRVRAGGKTGEQVLPSLDWRQVLCIAAISVGLYGFGMSLNDIIDHRRDRQLASHRPLPSGRVGMVGAHVVSILLVMLALSAAVYYMLLAPRGWMSLILVIGAVLLICFYDFAGKYLVAPGLLTLGLIRFCHAAIPAPTTPLIWHPLLLLNHIVILSAVAYRWEQKRPALTGRHWLLVLGGLGLIDLAVIALATWQRWRGGLTFDQALWITPGLWMPILAAGGFVLLATWIRLRGGSGRSAGQQVMLYGLLWLIIYDASFALGYIGWKAAAFILLLAPVAWLSVQLIRWWSSLALLTRTPTFKRA